MPLFGIKALLIDDSNTIRCSGEIFLTQAGCRVSLAENGYDGLSQLMDLRPDVIVIDIMMPRLDGYQTCALIKNHPEFKNIPVIMLTSKESLFDRTWARMLGANHYLAKPFTLKNLVDAITACLPANQLKDHHAH